MNLIRVKNWHGTRMEVTVVHMPEWDGPLEHYENDPHFEVIKDVPNDKKTFPCSLEEYRFCADPSIPEHRNAQ